MQRSLDLDHDGAVGVTVARLVELPSMVGAHIGDDVDPAAVVHDVRVEHAPPGIALLDAAGAVTATVRTSSHTSEPAIITLDASTDLTSVALGLQQELLRSLRAMTDRSLKVLQSLTQAELAGADLTGIVDMLAELVGNPVIVKTPSHEVLAWSGDPEDFDAVRESTIESGAVTERVLEILRRHGILERLRFDHRPIRVEPDEEAGLGPRVVCPIHAGGVNLGYVSISEGHRELDGLDLLAVENAASVVGLHLAHERAVQEAVLTRRALLVSELLFRGGVDSHRAQRISQLLEVDLDQHYAVVVFPVLDGGTAVRRGSHRMQTMATTLNVLLSRFEVGGIATAESDCLLALLPEPQGNAKAVGRVLKELMAHHPDRQLAAGVSRPRLPSGGLQVAYDEAHLAAKIGADLNGPGSVTTYVQLGALNLLGQLEPAAVDRYLDGVLGPDVPFRQEFLETYRAVADAGYNKAAAARELGLHVNTVQYRLDKIHKMTGFDPEQGNGRFTLECALRLLELAEAQTQH